MAVSLWGRVYFRDWFAGILERQPGGRFAFTYDESYVADDRPAIAHTLPLWPRAHYCEAGLHPFFDNLVAEGWLRNAQARALGVNRDDRFALLLAFGRDCTGAVSVVDPEPAREPDVRAGDPEELAAIASRASLSGVQPKLLAVRADGRYRLARAGEPSTHIAKLPSGQPSGILEIEFLSTLACSELLPGERVVDMEFAPLGPATPKALLVRRFDRHVDVQRQIHEKIHFEEFAQLLGRRSDDKYDGSYEEMGRFMRDTPRCVPGEADRLYRRVLAYVLIGNTDAHLKNFAMLHTPDGLRLAPAYDVVASAMYKEYRTLALSLAGAKDLRIGELKAKHIFALGEGLGLAGGVIGLAIEDLRKRRNRASTAISASSVGDAALRKQFVEWMDKRWNGTFESIGSLLSKRRSSGDNSKGSRKRGSRLSRA